jgi:hypothetical protein
MLNLRLPSFESICAAVQDMMAKLDLFFFFFLCSWGDLPVFQQSFPPWAADLHWSSDFVLHSPGGGLQILVSHTWRSRADRWHG